MVQNQKNVEIIPALKLPKLDSEISKKTPIVGILYKKMKKIESPGKKNPHLIHNQQSVIVNI